MKPKSEKLAISGGSKVRNEPFPALLKHNLEEWQAIKPLFERGSINMTRGPEVMGLRKRFCELFNKKFAVTASSGTAALHTAVAALGIGRGDEVITSPITDMGTIVAIVQQNAVPVFADVAPGTFMISPETVAEKITSRTRAVIPVHLAGVPCDVIGIKKVLKGKDIAIIEDVAQSYMASQQGHLVGTIGDIGCWSLNESKHIGAGDGGVMLTDNKKLAEHADLFADKCYDRINGATSPFMAPYNYRLSTLTAAVCLEQVKKVEGICSERHKLGIELDRLLDEIPGITPVTAAKGDIGTYWYYIFILDSGQINTDPKTFYEAMRAEGVYAGSMEASCILFWRYFSKPPDEHHACSFNCPLYDGKVDYHINNYPNVMDSISQGIRLSFNENYTLKDIHDIAETVNKVANYYSNIKKYENAS